MKRGVAQATMISFEHIISAQSAEETENSPSEFAGEISMEVSNQNKGLSQCSCKSTGWMTLQSGLVTP
jgi:hypothetical protein